MANKSKSRWNLVVKFAAMHLFTRGSTSSIRRQHRLQATHSQRQKKKDVTWSRCAALPLAIEGVGGLADRHAGE
jgi:hypothetical protein